LDKTARIWDITKQELPFIELKQPAPPIEPISVVAFSPDGKYALTGPWLWDLVEPMASLTSDQLLVILKLKQNPQDISDKIYRDIYERLSPEIKAYLKLTLNLQV
jgi:WD40 repeat protein